MPTKTPTPQTIPLKKYSTSKNYIFISRYTSATRSTQLNIFPDSGANICLAGPEHITALGVKPHALWRCHKKITAVGGSTLFCKGWLPVEFKIGEHRTKQPLHICDKIDRIYLSKQG